MNGRHAGKKGIIVRSNYENSKDKKFPHCLVVGLSKAPKRVTKKFLKKTDIRTNKLEKALTENKGNESITDQINKLKRLGIFVKTFNMTHLLATRYKVEEDFGISKNIENLDNIEGEIREKQGSLNKKETDKKEDNKEAVETLRKELGGLKDKYRNSLRQVKSDIGTQLYERYNRGFAKTRDNREENEKAGNAEFLFKKLQF